jgi:uncharacterized metal-binding protein YceD (DUF177 family)
MVPPGALMVALRLELSELKPGHNRVVQAVPPSALGLPSEEWPLPLDVDVDADRAGDQVTLNAQVATECLEECARCLAPFRSPLEFAFSLHADRSGSGGRYERELELDDYVVFHDGRRLDLDEQLREAALLARPMAPLCRPDCKGLCTQCGADLNEGPCPHATGARV